MTVSTTGYSYQGEDDRELQYNDYAGYFEDMLSEEALKIKSNVRLFKSLKIMIDEFHSISSQQELENMRKDDLIIEMAHTMEQIYLNTGQPHLVETIASSLCLIINKKDKITHPTYIYRVLQARNRNKYVSDYGKNKRHDIYSKRNISFNEMRDGIAKIINHYEDYSKLDQDKKYELDNLWHRLDELKERIDYENNRDVTGYVTGSNSQLLPQAADDNNNNNSTSGNGSTGDNKSQNQISGSTNGSNTDNNSGYHPTIQVSKYYTRLEQYISILEKLKENVLRFPPSKELDDMLDKSLAVEIEILMPSIDMKFKRSIPQLDETIQYANDQSLNGASSVMHETALIRDDKRGTIQDPNNVYARFLEVTHKLTPEQIDTRRIFVSNIRRKMARYNPHLYYHIQWYEGSDKYNHKLAMGKFARSNLLKKKIMNN